jgi:hypothetical protein
MTSGAVTADGPACVLADGSQMPMPSLAGSKAAELDKALGYFEHNAHCLHYARVKSLSMFIGSGGVEAGARRSPGSAESYPA